MTNLQLVFPEIFLSLSIMFLLILGVFKKNSSKIIQNLSLLVLLVTAIITFNETIGINEVKLFNPDEIVLLPLYPQFSASTSASSIKEWEDICEINEYRIKTSIICCYPTDDNFIKAHSMEINNKIKNLKNFKLIFSAHGLPERNIKEVDRSAF